MNVAKERAPKEKSEMDTGEGERERGERRSAGFTEAGAGRGGSPLCVRASPSRYCATRRTRRVGGREGARRRGHRVGAERDYRCKSPRTKGSLLVALME